MSIQRLTHMGICVSNLERSLRFYRDLLGCKEVGRLELRMTSQRGTRLADGTAEVELPRE